jgi:hypothetical protein
VFIKSSHPLAIGTRVNLRFTVIMDRHRDDRRRRRGRSRRDGSAGMGVRVPRAVGYSKGPQST